MLHARDFHHELEVAVLQADPKFQLQDLGFCAEFVKAMALNGHVEDTQSQDETVQEKSAAAETATYDADRCRVSHDVAKFAAYQAMAEKRLKKLHVLKVLHLRSQNDLGAKIVDSHMRKWSVHVLSSLEQADVHVDEVLL